MQATVNPKNLNCVRAPAIEVSAACVALPLWRLAVILVAGEDAIAAAAVASLLVSEVLAKVVIVPEAVLLMALHQRSLGIVAAVAAQAMPVVVKEGLVPLLSVSLGTVDANAAR